MLPTFFHTHFTLETSMYPPEESYRKPALPVPMVCPACGTEYQNRLSAVEQACDAGRSMEAGVDYLQCSLCTLSYNEAIRAVRDAIDSPLPQLTRSQARNQRHVSNRPHRH